MLKTKSSRAGFFQSNQKRVLILNGLPVFAAWPLHTTCSSRVLSPCHPLISRSGLVLCYYEPRKHTDQTNQKAKGYLPLWMLSKIEADVSSATPQFSLEYRHDTFTFKGLHPALQPRFQHLTRHLLFFAARKRFPEPARDFVTVYRTHSCLPLNYAAMYISCLTGTFAPVQRGSRERHYDRCLFPSFPLPLQKLLNVVPSLSECPHEPKWHAEVILIAMSLRWPLILFQERHATVCNRLYMTCREESQIRGNDDS